MMIKIKHCRDMDVRRRDRLCTGLLFENIVRVSMAKSTNTAIEAIRRHKLIPMAGMLLGDMLTAALLAAAMLKNSGDVISFQIRTDGLIKELDAEAYANGEVRKFALETNPVPPSGKTEATRDSILRDTIGSDRLTVRKWVESNREAVTGITFLTLHQLRRQFV